MLGLIDLAFTVNLVLIVIFSGYENFVSKIETGDHDRPDWMTKVDFGGLKQKLMTSIVAISAIQVLKAFMNIEQLRRGQHQARLAGRHPCAVPGLAAGGRLADRCRPFKPGAGYLVSSALPLRGVVGRHKCAIFGAHSREAGGW